MAHPVLVAPVADRAPRPDLSVVQPVARRPSPLLVPTVSLLSLLSLLFLLLLLLPLALLILM